MRVLGPVSRLVPQFNSSRLSCSSVCAHGLLALLHCLLDFPSFLRAGLASQESGIGRGFAFINANSRAHYVHVGLLFIHLSHSLNNSMLRRVVHSPMSFFYSNPLGRIINRFSRDTATADSVVAFQTMQTIQVSPTLLRCSIKLCSSWLYA